MFQKLVIHGLKWVLHLLIPIKQLWEENHFRATEIGIKNLVAELKISRIKFCGKLKWWKIVDIHLTLIGKDWRVKSKEEGERNRGDSFVRFYWKYQNRLSKLIEINYYVTAHIYTLSFTESHFPPFLIPCFLIL